MPQLNYHNPGNPNYMGTVSNLDPTKTTARQRAGKNKANKREPRTNTVPLSDTRVYKSRADMEAGKVLLVIPRKGNKVSAQRTTSKHVTVAKILPEVTRFTDTRSMDEIRRMNGL